MEPTTTMSIAEAESLCIHALQAAGAKREPAAALARAIVDAEASGAKNLGFTHLLDYLDSLRAGRITGSAVPVLTRPAKAIILSDAQGGFPHTGFSAAFDDIVATAEDVGIAIFCQHNAYTCGALGYFAERLAERGLIALATANAPAQLAAGGSHGPVFGTNPMAFAAPCNGEAPLLIDQASSARAFVNIRDLAMAKRPIPQGWAVDENGNDTTDAAAALKGALLPFGGAKGGNIAMMVEILATASGGLWSVDAPSYLEGDKNSAVGMFVLAIQPAFLNERFSERLSEHLQHLQENYGVYVPGSARRKARKAAQLHGLHLDESVVEQVAQFITPY